MQYLDGLEVGQQVVLAALLAQNRLLLLSQLGLNQLQHVPLLAQALRTTLRHTTTSR